MDTVSYIITIFNKAEYLALTIQSVLQQQGVFKKELVLVDDASTDKSVEIIEKIIKENVHKDVEFKLIKNNENCGPAIRVNQGCKEAKGRYLHLLDADDILAQGSTNLMLTQLKQAEGDFCYGHYKKTDQEQSEILGKKVIKPEEEIISEDPLDYILKNKVVRMGQLITKEIFNQSGGCDERLFIQDESLPLRMAIHAKRAVFLRNTVIFSPRKTNNSLSANTAQQQHDKFFAYYFAYEDNASLTKKRKHRILAVAVSSLWKAYKKNNHYNLRVLFLYVLSKLNPCWITKQMIINDFSYIQSLTPVRYTNVFKAN